VTTAGATFWKLLLGGVDGGGDGGGGALAMTGGGLRGACPDNVSTCPGQIVYGAAMPFI
jgi:hypothetical protein